MLKGIGIIGFDIYGKPVELLIIKPNIKKMGLDTTHNAWHGPYSSFNTFRVNMAKMIGMDLNKMEGFGGDTPFSQFDDDLCILLDHSDCDGDISPEDCKKLSVRLDELIKKMHPQTSVYQFAKQFSAGCKLAASRNETLKFH